jgi:predicted dehydrogenase
MVRVGFVGTGMIAKRHIDNISKIPSAKVAAVCDVNPETLSEVSKSLNVPGYLDVAEMVKNEELDGAFVCVPPWSHGEVEEILAENGVHLFIEKPLALSHQTVRQVRETIRAGGVISSVGFHWRYSQATDLARAEISGKIIGMVLGFWIAGLPGQEWWRKKQTNPAQIFEQTIHLFDLSRYLVGEITEVSALSGLRCMGDLSELDDVNLTSLTFEDGAIGSMASTYMVPYWRRQGRWQAWSRYGGPLRKKIAETGLRLGLWERDFDARSFHVELVLVLRDLVLKIGQGSLTKTTPSGTSLHRSSVDPYMSELQAFLSAISRGDDTEIRSVYDDAVKTHEVVSAAMKSADLRRPVPIRPMRR